MMNNSIVTLLITYISFPWIMFSFNSFVIIWRGGEVRLKSNVKVKGVEEFRTNFDLANCINECIT